MNTSFAEIIEQQKNLVAIHEQQLAEAKLVLEELSKSAEIYEAAEAAQAKIEEGQKELERAIAAMSPQVAEFWRSQHETPEHNAPKHETPEQTPHSYTQTTTDRPAKNDKPPQKDIDTDKAIDKAIDYIAKKKHQTNKTGVLRIERETLVQAAARLGVVVGDEVAKKEIAEAIAQTLEPDIPPFKSGDMVQTSQGQIGEVTECTKKGGDGELAFNSSGCEPTTSSGAPPANSELIDTGTNIDSPGNGVAMIPDSDMPANLVVG